MTIRKILCVAALSLTVTMAEAGPVEDSIARQLIEQGFTDIRISRTWLGRSRIVAESPELYREIIVNPATGEILRDFWRQTRGSDQDDRSIFDPGAGDRSGGISGSDRSGGAGSGGDGDSRSSGGGESGGDRSRGGDDSDDGGDNDSDNDGDDGDDSDD